jgi:anti-sigma B factor antagonist
MNDEALLDFSGDGRVTVGTIHSASVLDAINVTEFGQETVAYLKKRRGINLLMNFEQVTYLSSAVLTELLRIKEVAESHGGGLRLCALNDDIRKIFEITNLDKVFVMYDDAPTALTRYERSLDVEAKERAWGKDEES